MTVKRLKLDRTHLMAMVRDPAFYAAVPALTHLRDVALASHRMFREARDCVRCGGEWKFMQGVVDALFLKLQAARLAEPGTLEQVRAYLSAKKGYVCRPIVIYYRRSRKQGKIAKFQF